MLPILRGLPGVAQPALDWANACPLGEGATARVYRLSSGTGEVIVKVARDQGLSEQLVRTEARLLALLDSRLAPEIVGVGRVLEGTSDAPRLCVATRFVPGTSLAETRPKGHPARRKLVWVLARDLGRALEDLERAGLGHGDLKPANVLVTAEGARLLDFGLAGPAHGAPLGGTPRYLAPEVGEAWAERRLVDRWALGMLLAERLIEGGAGRSADELEAQLSEEGEGEAAGALHDLVRALLATAPARRPSGQHVARLAESVLRSATPRDGRGAVRTSYLALRRSALIEASHALAVQGEEALPAFARERLALLRAVGEGQIGTSSVDPAHTSLAPLDEGEVARLLARLVGPAAAAFRVSSFSSTGGDEQLLASLETLAEAQDPAAWSAPDVLAALSPAAAPTPRPLPADPVSLGIALASGRPSGALLDAAEDHLRTHPEERSLRLALLRALGRRGEAARALLVDRGASPDDELCVTLAELARRTGDRALAHALLGDRSAALSARLAYDEGDVPRARALAFLVPPGSAQAAEVRALVLAAEGQYAEAAAVAENGLVVVADEEGAARLYGTLGFIAHGRGEALASLVAYREAARAAARAGALVEEATYLTGLCAAATDAGAFDEAKHASARAVLLWESLGRRRDAGRALLTGAAVRRILGSDLEARAYAREAATCAREAGDLRATGYAALVLADAAETARGALDAATQAAGLLPERGDALRAAARGLGGGLDLDTVKWDTVASTADLPVAARLDWWTARAGGPLGAEDAACCLAALVALIDRPAPVDARGRALEATLSIARARGDGAVVRRAAGILRQLASAVVAQAPGDSREVEAISWVRTGLLEPVSASSVLLDRDDAAEVLRLFRVLSTRDSLRDVLRQVLDALVLWTGVERGLLLMPRGDTLVPRAARNLSREDLRGHQQKLSLTLATRAFRTQEPVLAVDASGEEDVLASVHALRLRSVLAVPLVARGDVVGVVYLDDRVRRGAFGEREIAWVTLAAGAAALAVADTRDRVLLRRAVRQSERARKVAEGLLAEKESALVALERTASPRAGVRPRYPSIIGSSPLLNDALRLVDRVAPTDLPVLLSGESGTGKDLFARAVHDESSRKKRRFVSENCAAIPETLLESTLFGHERGAFTGAVAARAGLFTVADGGTLFLDEEGERPLPLQAKLLRVLQDGELRPVGSNVSRRVDIRLVTATHHDLRARVRDGHFREDLFYRLCVVEVKVPALRERAEDIPALVDYFLKKYDLSGRGRVTREALDCLVAYPFPGNVRQLENELRRALALGGGLVDLAALSDELRLPAREGRARALSLHVRDRIDDLERELIREALGRTGGNKTRAAELLGVSRFGLSKMEKRLAE